MTFDTLIGKKVTLVAYSNDLNIKVNNYGMYDNGSCTFLKYKFDDKLYILKITENPDDGYRNSLGDVTVVDETDSDYKNAVFNKLPPAKVTLVHDSDKTSGEEYGYSTKQDAYEFIDDTGVVWFVFGTDNIDDYYPSYFCYTCDVDLKGYREAILGDILDD